MLKFRWETEFRETETGKIPKDWEVKELGKVIKINKKPRNTEKKPIAFISMENIPENSLYPKFEVKNPNEVKSGIEVFPGSLLLAKITPSFEHGKSCIVPKESNYKWVATTEVFSILPKDDMVDLLYLFYFFKIPAIREGLQYTMTGTSGRQRVPKDALEQLEIPYPPLEEQTRIATVLSWFDDLIENKKKQNEILEKTAMAIFKSWFVDFEPFQDEKFVYSEELGMEIPEGWEVDFTTKFIDYNPPLKLEKGRICPFVEMKDVNTDSLVCEFSFKEFFGSGVRYRGGDTLMARITPSLEHGKTAYVWFISENEKGFGTTEFFVLHPRKPWLREFVYLLAKNDEFREVAINSMSGTSGRQRADVNALKNYLIPIPPEPILQRFHSLVEPLFQKIINNQKQILTLRKIRDTLLPQLVFGRLRVEEI